MSIINQTESDQVSQRPLHLMHAWGTADIAVTELIVRLAQEVSQHEK